MKRAADAPLVRIRSGPKRPVEKEIFQNFDAFSTLGTLNSLHTSTVAETFSGGHLTGNICFSYNAADTNVTLALLYVKDQQTTPALSAADGSSIQPETSVLWSAAYTCTGGTGTVNVVLPIDVKIKTMRKMMKGDQIYLGHTASTTNGRYALSVTLFYKQ